MHATVVNVLASVMCLKGQGQCNITECFSTVLRTGPEIWKTVVPSNQVNPLLITTWVKSACFFSTQEERKRL